jgi:GT2 family glycosyltransferase
MRPDFSVIIVNYFSYTVLKGCLKSLRQASAMLNVEIIVVNNGDLEQNLAELQVEFSEVIWLETGYNAGFARANNLGIAHARAPLVLLLNSDTLVPKGILEYLQLFMNNHQDVVASGVQLVYPDGSPQISGNFAVRGGLNYLMMIPYWGDLLKWIGKKAGLRKPNLSAVGSEAAEVDWINGAFLLVRRSAIEKAGMLDPDFFLYHEESEWCSRLKKQGKLVVLSGFSVVHFEGYSSAATFQSSTRGHSQLFDKKGKQLWISLLLRLRKEFGVGWLCFHLLTFTLALPTLLIISAFHQLFFRGKKDNILQKILGFCKNILSGWVYLPKLLLGKPYFYKVI